MELNKNSESIVTVGRNIKTIKQAMASYQLINDAEESAIYMHSIRVRSFLWQQLSSLRDENRDWHYPFMLFAIKEGDTWKLLELDFVRKIVSIHLKDHSKSDFSFNQIKDVIQGKNHDEFVIDFSTTAGK